MARPIRCGGLDVLEAHLRFEKGEERKKLTIYQLIREKELGCLRRLGNFKLRDR